MTRIYFLRKRSFKNKEGSFIFFSIVSIAISTTFQLSEYTKSIEGVTYASRQNHDIGMGYWIDVIVTEELFDKVIDSLKIHIHSKEYESKELFSNRDWSSEYLVLMEISEKSRIETATLEVTSDSPSSQQQDDDPLPF